MRHLGTDLEGMNVVESAPKRSSLRPLQLCLAAPSDLDLCPPQLSIAAAG